MRKTKIVCTMGPSTEDGTILREMVECGMNVARFNFSHGDHAEHTVRFNAVCKLRKELGVPLATMLDTRGPEVRLGKFKTGSAKLKRGQTFVLTNTDTLGDDSQCSVSYPGLIDDVPVGTTVLLADGLVEMEVISKTQHNLLCRVKNDGEISDRKGINIPSIRLNQPYISQRDEEDIEFGLKIGFDFIAASFVRTAEDVLAIRKILDKHDVHTIKIIAKIENLEGVNNATEILKVADGLMVARGDLGVEIPFEEIPAIQKQLIRDAYQAGKVVITATQMLESMMKNPRPTRAETTDVANAVYDGTSAVMLSGETAAGLFPVEAVRTMARIASTTEENIDYTQMMLDYCSQDDYNITTAVSHATVTTAHDLKATAILTVTKTGTTARMISRFRPTTKIIGCTPSEKAYNQMALSWGITPLLIAEMVTSDELFDHAVQTAKNAKLIGNNDLVVITTGVPVGVSGTTNMLKVHIVGDVLAEGTGVNDDIASGKVFVCKGDLTCLKNFNAGDVLVIKQTTNEIMPLIRNVGAIVTETDGLNSHAAIVGLTLDIPVVVGVSGATSLLKTGMVVQVDAGRGYISSYSGKLR